MTVLFWQLLINPDNGYLDALQQTRAVVMLSLVVFYVVITLATWWYFRWRPHPGESAEELREAEA